MAKDMIDFFFSATTVIYFVEFLPSYLLLLPPDSQTQPKFTGY